ncbi:MAG: AsmA family protein [Nitrospira sp.]|nr:AsmA family protein [Nitrospira sp.]MCP9441903.1 AsmA family protein [Nitrospira sp.]
MKVVMGMLTLVAAVVGITSVLPFLIDLQRYQDRYKPLIEGALNRTVQIQDIRLTLWPPIGVRMTGLSVLGDPAFGAGPFASMASSDVRVNLPPLLSGTVEMKVITLRDVWGTRISSSPGRPPVMMPRSPPGRRP